RGRRRSPDSKPWPRVRTATARPWSSRPGSASGSRARAPRPSGTPRRPPSPRCSAPTSPRPGRRSVASWPAAPSWSRPSRPRPARRSASRPKATWVFFSGGWRSRAGRRPPPTPHLLESALVTMDALHHPFEHRVEDLSRLLGITVGEQLHRALEVGEQDGDLLALALERGLGREDLFGEVLGVEVSGVLKRGPPVVCDATGSPHSKQNFAPAGSSLRHFVQISATRAPHSRQNFAWGGFACWHRGHFISSLHPAGPGCCRKLVETSC